MSAMETFYFIGVAVAAFLGVLAFIAFIMWLLVH